MNYVSKEVESDCVFFSIGEIHHYEIMIPSYQGRLQKKKMASN